jgi:hypothetical protein
MTVCLGQFACTHPATPLWPRSPPATCHPTCAATEPSLSSSSARRNQGRVCLLVRLHILLPCPPLLYSIRRDVEQLGNAAGAAPSSCCCRLSHALLPPSSCGSSSSCCVTNKHPEASSSPSSSYAMGTTHRLAPPVVPRLHRCHPGDRLYSGHLPEPSIGR